MNTKSAKFSLSFPAALFAAMEEHRGARDRSDYFQRLVEEDLRRAGKLFPDEVTLELARTRELIEVRGLSAVKAKLDELALEHSQAAGGLA